MTTDSPLDRPVFAAQWERFFVPCLLAAGLLVRLWLIHSHPAIFGGDSVVRLANRDRILLAYQLPALQAAIHYLGHLSESPLVIRYFMALVGAVAGAGFYYMARALLGRTVALASALFFITNPFLLAFSIVPYQEILMLAGLSFAFYFVFEQKWAPASLVFGLACLTRYESWAAAPVLVWAYAFGGGQPTFRHLVQAGILFGWAPLAWIVYNIGFAPPGSFVVDLRISAERLLRYVYLGWITVKNTPIPVLVLAGLGFARFWSQSLFRSGRYRLLAAFFGLFLVAILFSAHGERDQPERFVTAREAHLPIAAVCLLGGLGLARLPRFRAAAVVLSVVLGLWMADRFVARENDRPRVRLAYELAQYLNEHVGTDERVAVLARPIPREGLRSFLDKATDQGGAAGRTRALRTLAQLDTSPPDYQRTLIHSRLGKQRLQSFASLPLDSQDRQIVRAILPPSQLEDSFRPKWLAVWSDFEPTNATERRLYSLIAGQRPVEMLERDSLAVRIYRLE